ncbi:MAG TPA: SulP family inorganic anion transporter [Syntrophobacteraceae bacterium]|nr:SulP family inorganic anion transporter [Syntrophobacteraceae bacterium]
MVRKLFPFIEWLKISSLSTFKLDVVSGLTVALVLIPQSMAYAQLAGMPVIYGLYASFLPPMAAALFGSSRQLATGPVAIVSLMTSAALSPYATAGSEGFISYAVLLALIVGVFQLALGILRLGLVVNFLSHPVVNGFTNAGAIIIATSQLSKMFNVNVDDAEHHYETVYRVIKAALAYTHWPTLALGAAAFVIMYGLRQIDRRIPYVLVAVALTTVISWAIGYENNVRAPVGMIASSECRDLIARFNSAEGESKHLALDRAYLTSRLTEAEKEYGSHSKEALAVKHECDMADLRLSELKEIMARRRAAIRSYLFKVGTDAAGNKLYFPAEKVDSTSSKKDGPTWRVRVGNSPIDEKAVVLVGGGSVVGAIPRGLPRLEVPKLDFNILLKLFPIAAIISLLGFMEAISIAKAMAGKTGQRLDPNQELIGQGIANVMGSLTMSFTVSGSFSRSAVNFQAGAVTGFSSVVTTITVAIVLLFFTPLLYHLPQSVLAAVIMMAVMGLINVSGFIHAWKAQWYDGLFSIVTFVATLFTAPHLDKGIMIGVLLSLGMFLYKSMRPKVTTLSMYADASFQSALHHGLEECRHIAMIRFDGALFYANASYLEEKVTERMREMPELKHIVIVSNGINDMDASGEEMLSLIVDRVRAAGCGISFAGLNEKVLGVMERTHLLAKIEEENIYSTISHAVEAIHASGQTQCKESCPLLSVHFA